MAKTSKQLTTHTAGDVGKGPSFCIGGITDWCRHYRNQCRSYHRAEPTTEAAINKRLGIWISYPTDKYLLTVKLFTTALEMT